MPLKRTATTVITLLSLSALAHAANPLFRVTDIGLSYGQAFSINAFGQVAATPYGGGAYLWTPTSPNAPTGSLIEMPAPAGTFGTDDASGLNDAGQLLVKAANIPGDDNGSRYYVWTPAHPNGAAGTYTRLASRSLAIGIAEAVPNSINNRGQVAGQIITTDRAQHFAIWNPTAPNVPAYTLTDLGAIGPAQTAGAAGINASGQIAGFSYVPAESDGHYVLRPALWTPDTPDATAGSFRSLTPPNTQPPAADYSAANAINDAGQIAGQGNATINGQVVSHAFLWNPDPASTPVDLGGPPNSSAHAINADGAIVGYAFFTPDQHAFLWTATTGMLDLNSLLDPTGTGWTLYTAVGINTAGQITGTGRNPAGNITPFLLTPVPEPISLLAACGFAISFARRRPRKV